MGHGLTEPSQDGEAWLRAAEIADRTRPPILPDRDLPITRFGAVGDGVTDCTAGIADAIAACHAEGGGRVTIPDGTYVTGAVHLLSNVELHLADGATLRFCQAPDAYLPVVHTRWQGIELMNYSPLIHAAGRENVAITGRGILDGGADHTHWWPWKGKPEFGWRPGMPNELADFDLLQRLADDGVPVEERAFGEGHFLRPPLIGLDRCRNVLISDVTLRNSPFWMIHPALCQNVTVEDVIVDSLGPNNDGCDPESCRDVVIRRCSFNNGDDCIAIKAGRNADGRRVGIPSENIVIEDCEFAAGHGGVTIGSEMTGGVRWVFVRRCRMSSPDLDTALRFKTNSRRGGFIEEVHVRDVAVGQVARAAIHVDFSYEEGDGHAFPPRVTGIDVRALTVERAARAWELAGYPSAPIGEVSLTECEFASVSEPNIAVNATLHLEDVTVNGQPA